MEAQVQQTFDYDELLDIVELKIHETGVVNHIEPFHQFTPGLYTRSLVDVPVDSLMVSYIHQTEHQFIVSKGKCIVMSKNDGNVVIQAPYIGKTQPETRRMVVVIEPITWTSIHATSIYPKDSSKEAFDEAVRLVEAELYEKRENEYLIDLNKSLCQD